MKAKIVNRIKFKKENIMKKLSIITGLLLILTLSSKIYSSNLSDDVKNKINDLANVRLVSDENGITRFLSYDGQTPIYLFSNRFFGADGITTRTEENLDGTINFIRFDRNMNLIDVVQYPDYRTYQAVHNQTE